MEKVKRLLKNKSIKNGIWMYLLQFFNAVIPLLTLPYITRILGAARYGVFSIALNIVTYMQVVIEYGFGMSATRKVALNDERNLSQLFTAVFLSRILLLFICAFAAVIYMVINRSNAELCFSFLVLMICLLGYCCQMNWLFQGLQEMKYISLVNIFSRTISIICIFLFVRETRDLLWYCFFYSVSPFLSGFIGLIISAFKYKIRLLRISATDVINELRDGFFVFTTQLSSKVFGAIGITFMGIFAAHSEVGIFSAIQKITNIMILGWTPITQVLYPISSKHMKEGFLEGKKFVLKMRRIILPIFILLAAFVGVFAKWIIQVMFGSEYVLYWYWIIPLLCWMILSINNNFMGIQMLLASGYDKEYSKCFQIGVVCTVALNFVLIYLFKGNGASIAPALSEAVLSIALMRQMRMIDKSIGDQ